MRLTMPRMSQTDVVLRGIKAMITGGQLKAGSRLPGEKVLTETLGVSRGPLREGVRALCTMGVLETRWGIGTFVTSLDSRLLLTPVVFMVDLQTPENRRQVRAVRRVLEAEAAGRAALTITPEQIEEATALLEGVGLHVFADQGLDRQTILDADVGFHRIVARASENGALAALVDALTDRTPVARGSGVDQTEQVRRDHLLHIEILNALKQRDPDRARILMSHHLLAVEDAADVDEGGVALGTA
jgi:GntR family transcriptional repressor for pyruvate dehydrogenase complex